MVAARRKEGKIVEANNIAPNSSSEKCAKRQTRNVQPIKKPPVTNQTISHKQKQQTTTATVGAGNGKPNVTRHAHTQQTGNRQ
jgi:hypothetical protein